MLSDQLKESEKEIESLTKKLSKVQNENERQLLLLERESNNHFYIGLKHHSAGEYLDASKEYKAATELQPKSPEAYNNWGVALTEQARTKSVSEAEALYNEAFEKYREVTKYKLDCHDAYNSWGVALAELAQLKSGSEAEKLYNEAFEKYQQAIKNGGSYYNLACLYAIRNKKEEALKYLERSLSRHDVSVEIVEKDKDWDGLRDDSDFKRIFSNTKG